MEEDYREPELCERCWGEGQIVTCPDDMCYGSDRCIHGDGYLMCPNCKLTFRLI